MDTTEQIKSLVEAMSKSSEAFDQNPSKILSMLTDKEKSELVTIKVTNPPIFDNVVIKDPVRQKLVDCKLATRTSWRGEEGYTRVSFAGYAVLKLYRQTAEVIRELPPMKGKP